MGGCGLSKTEWEQLEARRQQCLERQNMSSKPKTTVPTCKLMSLQDSSFVPSSTPVEGDYPEADDFPELMPTGNPQRGSLIGVLPHTCHQGTLETYKSQEDSVSI